MKELGLGTVEIFCRIAPLGCIAKNSAGKCNDAPRAVEDREHDAAAKAIVETALAALDKPRALELPLKKALPREFIPERAPAFLYIANAPVRNRGLGEAALDKVLTRIARAGKPLFKKRTRALERGKEPRAHVCAPLRLVNQGHAGTLGEEFQRAAEIKAIEFLNERKDIAFLGTSEAIIRITRRRDKKRGSFLIVERAACLEVRPGALKLHIAADEISNREPLLNLFSRGGHP